MVLNHQDCGTLEKTDQGYKKPARQRGGASLLEDDTHVLLASKLEHFLDIVNIKHYCNLFRT